MLTSDALVALYRKHRTESVLSVYLDASQTDPANRANWSRWLNDQVRDLRRQLTESGADSRSFDAAHGHIEGALGNPDRFLSGRGWAGFATESELIYAEGLPVPMPNLIRWEAGVRVAPYLRAVKQSTPVPVAIADSRRVRIFCYLGGSLEERYDLHADRDFGDLSDSSGSRRAGRTSGVRGETGKDKAAALLDAQTDRLIADAADRLVELADDQATIVLGGVEPVVARLEKALPAEALVSIRPGLSFDDSLSDLRAVVEEAASQASRERQSSVVERTLDAARSGEPPASAGMRWNVRFETAGCGPC